VLEYTCGVLLSTLKKLVLDGNKRGIILWNKQLNQNGEAANHISPNMRSASCFPVVKDYMLLHLDERLQDEGIPVQCVRFFMIAGGSYECTKDIAELVLDVTLAGALLWLRQRTRLGGAPRMKLSPDKDCLFPPPRQLDWTSSSLFTLLRRRCYCVCSQ